MRVVVPYSGLHECCNVADYAPDAEFVQLPVVEPRHGPTDQVEAYWRLLCELWSAGEDFVVVEHDIEIHADVLPQFETCEHDWCVFPYAGKQPVWGGRGVRVPVMLRCALGCVRFRSELIRKYPSLIADLKYRRWDRLDSQIATLLQRKGLRAHQHEPAVIHHHDYGE